MRISIGAVLLCTSLLSPAAAGLGGTYARPDLHGALKAGQPLLLRLVTDGGMAVNPHSDLIFRATGATSCLNCHRAGKEDQPTSQVLDNALVQELRAKAKGIHGPGRFADCLRCHAGGNKGVEKYRK
ncbi:MAG: exported protein of unknown function, putative Diheme cytochrome c [Nitrospira sp.]|nr:exported protein of unknown function, putative Diheme cytochrome c [Nitrospira sp.]